MLSNVTEHVPVASSDHVAEIIGRMGSKIKSLRNKTNTFIQTPMREADPVFIITGSQENVAKAKWEILSAAAHFTNVRNVVKQRSCAPPKICNNQITLKFDVPIHLVGLIVGPRGTTIKKIQQESNTIIKSPSTSGDPIFEITGSPANVQLAQKVITTYIVERTRHENTDQPTIHIRSGSYLSQKFLKHKCLICGLTNIKSYIVVLPCGHFVCLPCARQQRLVKGKECPICSRNILDSVYIDI